MLKGEVVCLTEVRKEDLEVLFRWINDAETVRFNAPYRPVSPSAHASWFDGLGRDASRVALVIRLREDPAPLGVIQLMDIHPVHRSAELIIRIGEADRRGKGLGFEALHLALDFASRDLNLQRVWLRVFADNKRAIKAYEKSGFEQEGVMRRAAWIDGKWVDEIVMAYLRDAPEDVAQA